MAEQRSASPQRPQCDPNTHVRTRLKIIAETHANVPLRMRRNGEPLLPTNPLLVEVHVLVLARVDDLDVKPLAFSWTHVRRNDDEGTGMRRIPYALCWGIATSGDGELDCGDGVREAEQ